MTYTTVQNARAAIEAGAPRLTHITELSPGPVITYLWTADGHDLAEYYSHDDGSFAGGTIGVGPDQFPFTDLETFVLALTMCGGR